MKPDVDHGWSWLVLAGGCLMTTISEAYRQTSGIFYSEFMDTMNLSRTEAAIIIAVLNSMFMIPGITQSPLNSVLRTTAAVCFVLRSADLVWRPVPLNATFENISA